MNKRISGVRLRCIALTAVLGAVGGCGATTTDVTGTVSAKGRPVVYGTVSVIGSDQMTYYGTIQQDGTFTVPRVPVGPVKFGVYSPDPYFEPPIPPAEKVKLDAARRAAGIPIAPKPPKGKWFRLHAKYADPLSSGLAMDITSRNAPVDLRLE